MLSNAFGECDVHVPSTFLHCDKGAKGKSWRLSMALLKFAWFRRIEPSNTLTCWASRRKLQSQSIGSIPASAGHLQGVTLLHKYFCYNDALTWTYSTWLSN